MEPSLRPRSVDRRATLKTGGAIAAVQFTPPYIIKARGDMPVRIESCPRRESRRTGRGHRLQYGQEPTKPRNSRPRKVNNATPENT
jgi:hypothetical protein